MFTLNCLCIDFIVIFAPCFNMSNQFIPHIMVRRRQKADIWSKVIKAIVAIAIAALSVHSTDTGKVIIDAVSDVAIEAVN